MDDLPTVSGRKRLLSEADDSVLTPKKARAQMPPTPASSRSQQPRLPIHLQSVFAAYTAIEEALIPALATGGVSAPTADKNDLRLMNILNVLTHTSVPGLSLENLKRVVYLLEWNNDVKKEEDPFLLPSPSKQWSRGGNGIVLTPTTHLNRSTGRRSAAYGVGIQIDSGGQSSKGRMRTGMTTVTRWLEQGEERKDVFGRKLRQWADHHRKASREPAKVQRGRSTSPSPIQIPQIPQADLPPLTPPATAAPSTSTSPVKRSLFQTPVKPKSFVPFPTPEQTPSSSTDSVPSTPTTDSRTTTPSTARRDALRERIRQRSLQTDGTPTRNRVAVKLGSEAAGTARTKVVSQEELRRRTLLGRLEAIAECVASLLTSNTTGSAQRRRIMRMEEVVRVVVKSAKSPISEAEASQSLDMLLSLCPTFVTTRLIDRETWLEMPSLVVPDTAASPTKAPALFASPTKQVPSTPRKLKAPPSPSPSPGRRVFPASPGSGLSQQEIEDALLSREVGSPKRVRAVDASAEQKDFMTLRDVRERIRRELEKD